jgi:hypothetical protein
MKKYIFFVFLTLVTLTFAYAQSSATLDDLNEPSGKAEEARKRAMDFESPSYFPSEWEAIEAHYTEARSVSEASQSAIQQAISSLNSIIGEYDELFKKTIPLYAQAREDEIIAAREDLIKTGFAFIFPEFVKNADTIALTAQEQFEAEDYYTARETAAAALKEYETLLVGAKLNTARQQIIDRDFTQYDQENFEKADEVTKEALTLYEAGDKQGAVDKAEEALLRYNIVLTNGWVAYAGERKASAILERERSINDKVNIATREAFREAEAIFTHAEEDLAAENYEAAAILFTDSEARFAIARQETEEKRVKAMLALRLAQERIDESVETAIEAERIIEGGSK